MQDLFILGTSGNSLEILDSVLAQARAGTAPGYRVAGFLDDNAAKWGSSVYGVPVIGGLARVRELDGAAMLINGIGSTKTFTKKPDIIAGLGLPDERFATIVHPAAVVSPHAEVGAGSMILAGTVVSPAARIGRHVQILALSIISHDVVVEDFATIAGGVAIAGFVHIGRASYIGTNAAIRNDLSIGAAALVGMGSVVLRDVAAGAVVAGSPAREIKTRA